MSIKISYEADKKDLKYSPVSRLEMQMQDGGTWPELVQEFLNFLRGTGYSIPPQILSDEEDYSQKQEENSDASL
jgi:hypothetical protein